MYFYIFQNGKLIQEQFTNVRDRSLLARDTKELMDKNFSNDTQIIVSSKRFFNPVLTDEGIKEER